MKGRSDRITLFDVENTGMVLEFEAYDLFRRGGHHPRPSDIKKPRELFSFQAKQMGRKPVWHSVTEDGGKEAMVRHMHEVLMDTDVLVGWNSEKFDWRKAQHAFFMLGLDRVPEPHQVDLMKVVRRHFDFESNSLVYVSRRMAEEGLIDLGAAKIDLGAEDVSVKVLIDRIKRGDKRAMTLLKRYGLRDVTVLEAMWPALLPYVRLPHASPALALTDEGDKVCPSCSSFDTEGRGVRRTLQGAYPRRFCRACRAWYTITRATSMVRSRAV